MDETDLTSRFHAFLGHLAHELRNALAPVQMSLEILKRPGVDQDLTEQMHTMMERSVREIQHLVDRFHEASRIARGKLELPREPLELVEFARKVAEEYRPRIESEQRIFAVTLPPTPQWILGEASRLSQALGEILENAIQHTEPGDRISLSVAGEETRVALVVEDSGHGIDHESLKHLLPWPAALLRTPGAQGLGVGLAIASGLIAAQGGCLEAFSAGLERGARFSLWLPRCRQSGAMIAPTP